MNNLIKTLCFLRMVFFVFRADPNDKALLERAMKYIQQETCVKFIEVKPTYEFYSHYVHFIPTTQKR